MGFCLFYFVLFFDFICRCFTYMYVFVWVLGVPLEQELPTVMSPDTGVGIEPGSLERQCP